MKRSRFSEEQIVGLLREVDAGAKVGEVCRRVGVSRQTYQRWRTKFGNLEVSEARRLKQLEDENRRLKRAVAELTLDNQILKDLNSRKW